MWQHCFYNRSLYIQSMKHRTITYLRRKKAFREMLNPTNLKNMLKAGFYASKSPVVKRDILQVYSELNTMKTAIAV